MLRAKNKALGIFQFKVRFAVSVQVGAGSISALRQGDYGGKTLTTNSKEQCSKPLPHKFFLYVINHIYVAGYSIIDLASNWLWSVRFVTGDSNQNPQRNTIQKKILHKKSHRAHTDSNERRFKVVSCPDSFKSIRAFLLFGMWIVLTLGFWQSQIRPTMVHVKDGIWLGTHYNNWFWKVKSIW